MLSRWIRFIFWKPFEKACRKTPIVPLKFSIKTVTPSVELIRIDNILTRAISKLGGSYDYSVSYLIDKTLLIDTGFPWARKSMKKHFILNGLCNTIKYTVNTHSHEDHIGNNDLIKEITTSKNKVRLMEVGMATINAKVAAINTVLLTYCGFSQK